jgi:hypothetical protein
MEAAVAALEAAAKRTARAASAAKEAAVAASAAATEAAGVATAAKEAVAAALATAEQAAVASSRAKEFAMAAEAAAKESAADAAATAEELAAAMRYSKKRRFHHGGSGGGNPDDRRNLDFISALPDEVLGSIISLLPTEEGARTQAISRRWLPLWRSAPLNLLVRFRQGIKNTKLIALVSKILSEHRGHARRLLLFLFNPADIPARGGESKIDGWLRSQVLDGLQELDFIYRNMDMPLSVFRFAPTLRFARFSCCNFPESVSALRLKFPCLKQLTLHMVTTTDGLHSMLTGCTALESLELSQICGKGGLCISSQTLRSIAFSADNKNKGDIFHLVIKEAPALERLLPLSFYEGEATIQVIWAPKLEIFGLLSEGMPIVQFGTTIFEVAAAFILPSLAFLYTGYYSCLHLFFLQTMIAVSLTTKIHTMKVLVLDSIGPNLDAVVDFLKCFPCLVSLYIIVSIYIYSLALNVKISIDFCYDLANYDTANLLATAFILFRLSISSQTQQRI